MTDFDYDFAIVGSGFGGSVSALRLSEKRIAITSGVQRLGRAGLHPGREPRREAAKMGGGVAQSGLLEVLLGKASTAHILGGCPIGLTPEDGVVAARAERTDGVWRDWIAGPGHIHPGRIGAPPLIAKSVITT